MNAGCSQPFHVVNVEAGLCWTHPGTVLAMFISQCLSIVIIFLLVDEECDKDDAFVVGSNYVWQAFSGG